MGPHAFSDSPTLTHFEAWKLFPILTSPFTTLDPVTDKMPLLYTSMSKLPYCTTLNDPIRNASLPIVAVSLTDAALPH